MADPDPIPALAQLGAVLILLGGFWLIDSNDGLAGIDLDNLEQNATYTLVTTEKKHGRVISVKDTNMTGAALEERFGFTRTWFPKLAIGFLAGGLVLIVFAFRKDVFRFFKRKRDPANE